MSNEEGVIPFEVVLEATPYEVTPRRGKEALGTWRISYVTPGKDLDPAKSVTGAAVSNPLANLSYLSVCVPELKLRYDREG
jgi:hypothetical protein